MEYKDFMDFKSAEGVTFDPTTWLEVTQEMIDHFAQATHDHQWIHVDEARAAKVALQKDHSPWFFVFRVNH